MARVKKGPLSPPIHWEMAKLKKVTPGLARPKEKVMPAPAPLKAKKAVSGSGPPESEKKTSSSSPTPVIKKVRAKLWDIPTPTPAKSLSEASSSSTSEAAAGAGISDSKDEEMLDLPEDSAIAAAIIAAVKAVLHPAAAAPTRAAGKRKAESPQEERELAKKLKWDPAHDHPLARSERAAGTGPVVDKKRTFKFDTEYYSRLPNPKYAQCKWPLRGPVPVPERFMRDNEESGLVWAFSETVGQGGFGAAELWLLVEESTKTVIEKIIIKHANIRHKDYRSWKFWEGGWKTKDGINFDRERVLEAAIHDRLTKTRPWYETNISTFITDWLSPRKTEYKLYLQYAQYGTIDKIWPSKAGAWRAKKDWEVPEVIIWWWLHCMMRAAWTMERGYSLLPEDAIAPDSWVPIVHMDIKGANIVLHAHNAPDKDPLLKSTAGTNWPVPLLIDFGLAAELRPDLLMNPESHRTGGTPGYMAPEQWKAEYTTGPKKGQSMPYGSHTNVFAFGMTAYDLIRGDHDFSLRNFSEWGNANIYMEDDDHELIWPEDSSYSDELREFVERCIPYNPEERLELSEDTLQEIADNYALHLAMSDAGDEWRPFAGFADAVRRRVQAIQIYVQGWIPGTVSSTSESLFVPLVEPLTGDEEVVKETDVAMKDATGN